MASAPRGQLCHRGRGMQIRGPVAFFSLSVEPVSRVSHRSQRALRRSAGIVPNRPVWAHLSRPGGPVARKICRAHARVVSRDMHRRRPGQEKPPTKDDSLPLQLRAKTQRLRIFATSYSRRLMVKRVQYEMNLFCLTLRKGDFRTVLFQVILQLPLLLRSRLIFS